MSYYIFIENGKPIGGGQCQMMNTDVINYEVTEAQYNAFNENPDCYVLVDGIPTLDQSLLTAKNLAKLLEEAKIVRADAVDKIVVEVDGYQFDGDLTAQMHMGFAVTTARGVADIANRQNPDSYVDYLTFTTPWILADNTVVTVTIEQLVKASSMAGLAMTPMWIAPHQ